MKTGVGDAVIDRARSASPASSTRTGTAVKVPLFEANGSVVCEVTSAGFMMEVPAGVAALTITTKVKAPVVVLLAMSAFAVQRTVPVPPTAGAVPQVHPTGAKMEEKVVLGGVC
jgi:hypothetical protein